ncbi:MAG TPA: amylo-alpha-1,6-glucosidase [Kofleriaceae bacterium]|nr:amylo-alpha-1,6-glucosidase [Kofleriaceae bacterium]
MSDADPVQPAADPIRKAKLGDELNQEWLVANGLGGYASGTVLGPPTRRYHGYLVAALANPSGRTMMLNTLAAQLRLHDGRRFDIGWVPPLYASHSRLELVEFRLELGLPVWMFKGHGITIEKRVVVSYGTNTVLVLYRLIDGGPARIELRPGVQFRGHDEPVSTIVPDAYPLWCYGSRIEVVAPTPLPSVRLLLSGQKSTFVLEPLQVPDIVYETEESRGYESRGQLFSPGRFRADLEPGAHVGLFASTESWDTLLTMNCDETWAAENERRRRLLDAAVEPARTGPAAELVLAADQFVIKPAGRREDHVRARAAGDEAWTVIAGYHWFTDWGRDTMISLEGLTLLTGRIEEAGSILRMFAHHIRDGLVPNMFPEGSNEGLYHTADATLWFFHALDRYLRASGDRRTLIKLLPMLRDVIDHHLQGTRFNIKVDPDDGLLHQGAPGYQLTWMDAKAGDWVVTPRRGKAVEINALWYNALRLMTDWLARTNDSEGAHHLGQLAERTYASFNRRFWNEATGFLYDVVDGEHGNDPACRPNQLFAISLPNPVLEREYWKPVLDVVERDLVTPLGLRSLSPHNPEFKPTYRGDLLARDAAYHQGTVWSWLIGPYIDALLRVHPDDVRGAQRRLAGLIAHLDEACVGNISEVFDAEAPYTPGGCIAQAWGVAELLRCLVRVTPRSPR